MTATPALKPGSLILITGINGYVAGHVADQLLALGYRVRGTARDQKKVDIAATAFKKYSGLFEGVVLADMSSKNAFHNVLGGIDGVVHVASDVSFGFDPNAVVTPVVKAMNSVLTAAAKESQVKRFVYTSSVIAAADQAPDGTKGRVIDESSWNTNDVKKAWAPEPYTQDRSLAVYAASKVAAEQAAWKFVEEHKPGFVLNTVLPSFCIGPKAFEGQNLSTSGWVEGAYNGDAEKVDFLRNFGGFWTVDIRDVARAHVAALLDTDVVGRRLLASTQASSFTRIVNAFKKINPERKDWPALPETDAVDGDETDNAYTIELLKKQGRSGFILFDETLRDQFASSA